MSNDHDARNDFGPFLPWIESIPFNDIEALSTLFNEKGNKIEAFLVEPIQGAAGVIIPDDDYWGKVRTLCDNNNILLSTTRDFPNP